MLKGVGQGIHFAPVLTSTQDKQQPTTTTKQIQKGSSTYCIGHTCTEKYLFPDHDASCRA